MHEWGKLEVHCLYSELEKSRVAKIREKLFELRVGKGSSSENRRDILRTQNRKEYECC